MYVLCFVHSLVAVIGCRYLCPQVPSLEQVVRRYEAHFTEDEVVDLAALPDDGLGMNFPLPPYVDTSHDYVYDVSVSDLFRYL